MTDRYSGFVVVLDHPIRSDDAEDTITALKQIKGVVSVTPHIVSLVDAIAEERVNSEWVQALSELIKGRLRS